MGGRTRRDHNRRARVLIGAAHGGGAPAGRASPRPGRAVDAHDVRDHGPTGADDDGALRRGAIQPWTYGVIADRSASSEAGDPDVSEDGLQEGVLRGARHQTSPRIAAPLTGRAISAYSNAQPGECPSSEPQPQHGVRHCRDSLVAMALTSRREPSPAASRGRCAAEGRASDGTGGAKGPADRSKRLKSVRVTTGPLRPFAADRRMDRSAPGTDS